MSGDTADLASAWILDSSRADHKPPLARGAQLTAFRLGKSRGPFFRERSQAIASQYCLPTSSEPPCFRTHRV
jgi:hypothetical protein